MRTFRCAIRRGRLEMARFQKRTPNILLLCLSLGLVAAACETGGGVSSSSREKVVFASASPKLPSELIDGIDDDAPLESFGYLEFPKSYVPTVGPVPLVILAHSSSGKIDSKYRDLMHNLGLATFELRSFEARGVGSQPKGAGKVTGFMSATDALRALDVLAADPRIDAQNIGIIGWSHGGGVVVLSQTRLFRELYHRPTPNSPCT